MGRDGRGWRRFVRLCQSGWLLAARRRRRPGGRDPAVAVAGCGADVVPARLSAVATPARRDRAALRSRTAAAHGAGPDDRRLLWRLLRCSLVRRADHLADVRARAPALRRAWHRVVERVSRRDQPGLSLSAHERDERRSGDRRMDAGARAGGSATCAERRTRHDRGYRHPAESGSSCRCGDGVDGLLRGASRWQSRCRVLLRAVRGGRRRFRDRHRAVQRARVRISAHVRLRHHVGSVLIGILLDQRPAVCRLDDRRRDADRRCCDPVLHRARRSTRCANPVPSHSPRRFDAGRADVVPLLPAIRRVVVPPVPAADVAGDDAPGGGGAGIDRAAMVAARVSLRHRSRGRCNRVAWRQDGRRSPRVRSGPQRAPVRRRRAVRCRSHRSCRRHPQRAAQRVAATLCRSSDAAIRRARSALARPRGGIPRVDWTSPVLSCWTVGKWMRSGSVSVRQTVRAPSTGRRSRRSAAPSLSTIQSAVVEMRHRSRLRARARRTRSAIRLRAGRRSCG